MINEYMDNVDYTNLSLLKWVMVKQDQIALACQLLSSFSHHGPDDF